MISRRNRIELFLRVAVVPEKWQSVLICFKLISAVVNSLLLLLLVTIDTVVVAVSGRYLCCC